jgi:hypothetical protein
MPRGAVQWIPILPDPIDAKHFRLEALNGLRTIGRRMVREFKRTTSTWDHQPKFVIQRSTKGGIFSVFVYTEDRIYAFVNNGTQVRYATMTDDFISKTRPGVLNARAGQGGLAFVSRQRPRPGLEARDFTGMIQDLVEPDFLEEMDRRMDIAAQKSGHAR